MTTEFKPDFNGKRIWMYWPDAKACQFRGNVEGGFMACEPLGGYDIGNIDEIGVRRIGSAVKAEYGYNNGESIKLMTAIYSGVKNGDYVIARSDFDYIVGIGVVTGDYYYDESRPNFKHCREVEWISTERIPFPDALKKSGKWHRVTVIDMPFREIVEQIIISICNGKDDGM